MGKSPYFSEEIVLLLYWWGPGLKVSVRKGFELKVEHTYFQQIVTEKMQVVRPWLPFSWAGAELKTGLNIGLTVKYTQLMLLNP